MGQLPHVETIRSLYILKLRSLLVHQLSSPSYSLRESRDGQSVASFPTFSRPHDISCIHIPRYSYVSVVLF